MSLVAFGALWHYSSSSASSCTCKAATYRSQVERADSNPTCVHAVRFTYLQRGICPRAAGGAAAGEEADWRPAGKDETGKIVLKEGAAAFQYQCGVLGGLVVASSCGCDNNQQQQQLACHCDSAARGCTGRGP